MRIILSIFVLIVVVNYNASAQGCVAIRSAGGFCTKESVEQDGKKSGWLFNTNVRYFRSFRHFVGTTEQKERLEKKTEVINYNTSVDLALTRILNKRWSLGIDVPIINNARSSLYEHAGARRSTHSFGLGDIRLAAYYWAFDPEKAKKGNLQVGLGIKLPTGDYRVQDYFRATDTTKLLGPVDQSIQLGDGGTGFTLELNGYYNFNKIVGVYGNFYYLANPREHNGVSTARGGTHAANSTAVLYGSAVMSVPDQFMVRAGANINLADLTISVGYREEALPSSDLFGGDMGFRRPGYIQSIEPGLTYKFKKFSAYAFVPIAFERNRVQSYADKNRTNITGVYAKGDAAFADYAVNVGFAFRF